MDKKQHVSIFTTASLPWMTGTAVNPLFRAVYLAKDEEREVTLVIPWLSLKDQECVYPDKMRFNSPSDQQKYIYEWLEDRTGFPSRFDIRFYPGKVFLSNRALHYVICTVIDCNTVCLLVKRSRMTATLILLTVPFKKKIQCRSIRKRFF